MEAVIVVLVLALLAMAGAVVWLLTQQNRKPAEDPADQRLERQLVDMKAELTRALTESRNTVLHQVNAVDGKLNQRLDAVDTRVVGSLASSQEMMGRIDQQLGAVGQSAQRILELREDVSSLRDVLQPPKLRGGFGELLLEHLVEQVLPSDHYSTQHRFRDNTIVDLVIHSPEGLVPVDSKFPIEGFRRIVEAQTEEERTRHRKTFVREVKVRIEEVARYIRPDDGTLDFALMYVPAENVYYETIAGTGDESAMTYALQRNVHICSPNTFHAFLQVVLRGFRGMTVQKEAKEIMTRLAYFQREFGTFRHEFEVLGTHIGRTQNKYAELDKLTGRLTSKLEIEVPVQKPLPDPELGLPQMEPARTNGSDN